MKTNKRRIYPRIALICCIACTLVLLCACNSQKDNNPTDAQSVLSHGVQILSAGTEMAVWGPRGNDVIFEANDFARNLNLSKINYIKVISLPNPA